jgi:oligopeptide/dipeptide ABC transporter ATP-binding protein
MTQAEPVLSCRDLHVRFSTFGDPVHVIRGVNFSVHPRKSLAIVGESGCGKSVTAQTLMQLHSPSKTMITAEHLRFDGLDLLSLDKAQMQSLRGNEMAMIFQDPYMSLNPTMTIGKQLTEGIRKHKNVSHSKALLKCLELLELVGLRNPRDYIGALPHELSGGMCQRVMIAMAISCEPKLLIADEPTTALDVTVQAQILTLMKHLQNELNMGLILITHNLSIVESYCDDILIMYAGESVEAGSVTEVFFKPQHPYTKGLLDSALKPGAPSKRLKAIAGSPPSARENIDGCAFWARCPRAMKVCQSHHPSLMHNSSAQAACWLHHEHAQSGEL